MGSGHSCCGSSPGAGDVLDDRIHPVDSMPTLLGAGKSNIQPQSGLGSDPKQEELVWSHMCPVAIHASGDKVPAESIPAEADKECLPEPIASDAPREQDGSSSSKEQEVHDTTYKEQETADSPSKEQKTGERLAKSATAAVAAVLDGYASFQESEAGQHVAKGTAQAAATASAFVGGFKDVIKDSKTGAHVSSGMKGGISSVKQTNAGRAVATGARDVCAAVRAGVARAKQPVVEYTEYTAVFDKSSGQKLGISIDTDTLCVSSAIGEGLVNAWNQESTNPQVSTGHRLIEVNGMTSKEALLSELQQNKILEVTLSKPKGIIELEVVVEKPRRGSRLGVTLSGVGRPTLKSLACDGLAHGKLQVGDQILSVNGWQADGHGETTDRMKQLKGKICFRVLRAE